MVTLTWENLIAFFAWASREDRPAGGHLFFSEYTDAEGTRFICVDGNMAKERVEAYLRAQEIDASGHAELKSFGKGKK